MKIGMIIKSLDISGGTARQIIMLGRELSRRGHEVTLYTFVYKKEKCFPDLLTDLRVVAYTKEYSPFLARFFRLRFIGTLVHQLFENRRCRALALHMHPDLDFLNPHEQISMRVAYYYKKRVKNIPSASLMSDLTLASWSLFDDPGLRPPKRIFLQRLINWLRDDYEIRKFIAAQEVIAVLNNRTKYIAGALLRRELAVTRTGVDTTQFPYKKRGAISGKTVKILCHGIFYIHRRFEDVIQASAALRSYGYDARLTIIGDYEHKDTAREYYTKLQRMVRELDLQDRVVFRGAISAEALLTAYNESDIFVFASHMQTWGIAVFEAMATGLPVVLSNTAGASEVLKDGENVLLFEALDFRALTVQLLRLSREPELYARLSKAGSDFVRSTITWERHADDFERFFAQAGKKHKQ